MLIVIFNKKKNHIIEQNSFNLITRTTIIDRSTIQHDDKQNTNSSYGHDVPNELLLEKRYQLTSLIHLGP